MRSNLWRTLGWLLRPWWVGVAYGFALAMPAVLFADGKLPVTVVQVSHAYGFLLLTLRVALDLAEPRARLVPRYRRTQVLAAGILFLLPLCLNSALLLIQTNAPADLSDVACVWATATCIAWGGQVRRLAHLLPLALAYGAAAALDLLLPRLIPPAAAAVLVWSLSGLALIWLAHHLMSTPEETCLWRRNWAAGGISGAPADGWWGTQALTAADLQRRFPAGNGRRQLRQRLRSATWTGARVYLLFGLIAVGVVAGCGWLLRSSALLDPRWQRGDAPGWEISVPIYGFLLLTIVWPAMMLAGHLTAWTRVAERAALWPVPRQRLVTAVGATIGRTCLQGWLSLVGVAALAVLLGYPAVLRQAWPWRVMLWSFASLLLLAGATLYLCRRFAAVVPNLAFQLFPLASIAFVFAGQAFLTGLKAPPTAADGQNALASGVPLALICAGFGLLGGFAAWRAWRAWTRGDCI